MNLKVLLCHVSLIATLISCNRVQSDVTERPKVELQKSNNLQSGDIIFQVSKSDQSKAIQLATHSKYSHMGIVYEQGGVYFVFEAIQPVQLTPLETWIKRGENGHYIVKRFANSDSINTPINLEKLKTVGQRFTGKNYDIYFGWSDERIYCSELVWKMYKEAFNIELGVLQKLEEFNLTSDEVKKKLTERYGNNIPINEPVISPSSIFEDKRLITVKSN